MSYRQKQHEAQCGGIYSSEADRGGQAAFAGEQGLHLSDRRSQVSVLFFEGVQGVGREGSQGIAEASPSQG